MLRDNNKAKGGGVLIAVYNDFKTNSEIFEQYKTVLAFDECHLSAIYNIFCDLAK